MGGTRLGRGSIQRKVEPREFEKIKTKERTDNPGENGGHPTRCQTGFMPQAGNQGRTPTSSGGRKNKGGSESTTLAPEAPTPGKYFEGWFARLFEEVKTLKRTNGKEEKSKLWRYRDKRSTIMQPTSCQRRGLKINRKR